VQLLLGDPEISSATRERVLRIERASAQMQDLIEGLLVLAREERTELHTPCPLAEVVQEAVSARQDVAGAKGIELRLTVTEPQLVRATAGLAASVISNLVANAVHHTECGGVEVRLERGRLTVTDTGSGIAAEDLPRVFEHRYRGSLSAGQGLGLYIVKRICDQLGWSVQIQSAPQHGTRVEVAFPVVG
jgi:signal transduction histidine kinase